MHHGLVTQHGLRAHGHQKGQRHLDAHGNGFLRKHGRSREHGQCPQKWPDDG